MKAKKPKSKEPAEDSVFSNADKSQFPIIGIGASAGGLEALEQFFKNMPNDTGMAFVVVQHLDPNYVGIMPELLQRITTMKVSQATDRLLVRPNCVYVIPPNKSMSILNGALYLFAPVETRGLRLPIDIFFRSLAEDRQGKSIGIILSGMGSDGSLGLKAIKEKNGLVLVQEPITAKFDGMPHSATDAVIADIVAPADELPAKLMSYLKFFPANQLDLESDSKIKSNFEKIIILLREQSGNDFSMYKKNTIFRRIERRKAIHQIDKISDYVTFLQQNPKETEILFKELLIGVTSFFRDTGMWQMLTDNIFPALFRKLPDRYVLRAWVTACSTGEEAYSLGMAFKEAIEKVKMDKNLTLQIFATDLDRDAIENARKAIFPKNIISDVSTERIARFFSVEGDNYRLNPEIREMVVFAPQNVIKDPPFTKLDVLSCRNMLIYMEPELQKKLIALFNYCLNPGGLLILGNAETIGSPDEGFIAVNNQVKIFQQSAIVKTPVIIDFPSSFYHNRVATAEKKKQQEKIVENIQPVADQIVLQRFAPTSVLVNDKGDILYVTGRTGKYLEVSAGKANWNILTMAREGLSEVLPGAFRKAMLSFDAVIVRNIKVGTNGDTRFADVTVQRLENPDSVRGMIMVVFSDVLPPVEHDLLNPNVRKQGLTEHMKELESELQRSYEELQSLREEMQTSQEELKSTNEELQSTNEELQSTNEEFTTSQEEMQSLNEELQTVNIEQQSKVSDYVRANDDMKNLLNSTEIATLFLDRELNIRRFTDQATKIFKLRNTDVGRPLTDMVNDLLDFEIEHQALEVMDTLIPIEAVTTTHDGRWYNVRIMPYRTLDDRNDGLVITFSDITIAKKLEIDLKEVNDAFRKSKEGQ